MDPALAVDASTLAEAKIDPWSIALAIVVLIAAWLLSRLTRRTVARVVGRLEGISDEGRALMARASAWLVIFLGIGVALSLLGASIQPLLAAAIVIGVVLALALRGIAENFAAGIVLQTRRPIRVGDEVESLDYEGVVMEMNSRVVVVETFDGRTVHLPNREVLSNPLVNRTSRGARRSEVEVRVDTDQRDEAIQRMVAAISAVPDVLDEPEPAAYLRAIDAGRFIAVIRFWHDPTTGSAATSGVVDVLFAEAAGNGQKVSVIAPPPLPPVTPPPPL